ncbi:MAG: hypothetical protein P9L99_17415 [Candidatus Lernaella stagnicola]|nr:hypothetical protein [Candidatus Lernaella stagnicola]
MDFWTTVVRQPKRAWLLAAVIVLLGLPLHCAVKDLGRSTLPPTGSLSPVLQGPTLAGPACEYDSVRDHGRVIVVAFLDPTQVSSVRQGEILRAWREHYTEEEQRVVFVLVFTDGVYAQQSSFAAACGIPLEDVVIDRGGYRQKPFGFRRTPAIFVIDTTGNLRFAAEGVVDLRHKKFHRAVSEYRPTGRLTPRKTCPKS